MGLGVGTAGRSVADLRPRSAIQQGTRNWRPAAQAFRPHPHLPDRVCRPAALDARGDAGTTSLSSSVRSGAAGRFRANYRTVSPQKERRVSDLRGGRRGPVLRTEPPRAPSTAGMLRVPSPATPPSCPRRRGSANRSIRYGQSRSRGCRVRERPWNRLRGWRKDARPRLVRRGLSFSSTCRNAAPRPLVLALHRPAPGISSSRSRRRIDSKRREGKWTPVRLVNVVSIGKSAEVHRDHRADADAPGSGLADRGAHHGVVFATWARLSGLPSRREQAGTAEGAVLLERSAGLVTKADERGLEPGRSTRACHPGSEVWLQET